MAKSLDCKYHPNEPARWQCCKCQRLYCTQCIPTPPEHYPMTKCYICRSTLVYLGGAKQSESFWAKVPYFLKYALDWNIIGFIAIVLVVMSAIFSGLLTVILYVVWASLYLKYQFQVISDISEGNFNPPAISEVFSGRGFLAFFRLLGAFLIFFGIGIVIFIAFKGFVVFYLLLVMMAWPAILMIMAREHSVAEAINPSRIFDIIKGMGWDYINLLIFSVLIFISLVLFDFLSAEAGASGTMLIVALVVLFSVFISQYAGFIFHAMMGYCLYRNQEELGYAAEHDEEYYDDEVTYLRTAVLAESYVLEKEKRYEEAVVQLRGVLEKSPDIMELNLKYHELLLLTKEKERLDRHGQHLIPLLLKANNVRRAAQTYLNVLSQSPDFVLSTPELRKSVAEGLFGLGKYKECIQLVKNMHKEFPGAYEIPPAYLLAAKALCEGLSQDKLALQFLDFIQTKFPNSPVVKEAEAYRQVIKGVANTDPAKT